MIKNIDISLILLVICIGRSVVSPDISFMLIIPSLVALIAYQNYMKTKVSPDLNKEVMAQLEEMRNVISGLSIRTSKIQVDPAKQEVIKRFF